MDFLETYLKAIESISPQDKEHTHRTALENLMNAFKDTLTQNKCGLKDLSIRQEPNNDKEGRGAPDFVILSQGLSIGYIENKRVNADLDSVAQSEQIKKYLCLSDNLMLTDYLRFCLIRKMGGGQ
ncbi:hypothetical protein LS68_003915 [Helicobacter sp. MIT 05-5293]|uniref:hypothetical protein n=1 Tax=Helicobacter sp. MIT 05-5293 TaxID=1548149 RepID=UPI00069026BB|nr:hypothetical protein LS68_003915 [Helicobacter sp. MIT 05-5293]